MDLFPFLLASVDVAASLAREITRSCEDIAKHKVSMVFEKIVLIKYKNMRECWEIRVAVVSSSNLGSTVFVVKARLNQDNSAHPHQGFCRIFEK